MTQRTPTTGKTGTTGSIGATATAGAGGASGKGTDIGAIANRTDAPRPTVPQMGGDAPPVRGTPSMFDVRGWDVVMTNGARLGTVERLIVDTAERMPRYLSVAPVGRNGSLLIPVGVGTLDPGKRQVVLHNLSAGTLEKLPLVTNGAITRELEREVFGAFTGRKASELAQPQWYADPLFDPTKLFGTPAPNTKS